MSILIHNCHIIDGSSEKALEKGWVLLSQGRIAQLGQGEPPAGAGQVIDAKGGTLLPGLINLHVHVHRRHLHRETRSFRQGALAVAEAPEALHIMYALKNLWYELSRGITTQRDTASPARMANKLRYGLETGIHKGPRLITCGAAVACTGGHGTHGDYGDAVEADGPYGVARAVRKEIKEGAQFIKLMASGGLAAAPDLEHPDWVEFTLEEMQAGVQAAHSHQRQVTVHAMGELPPLTALQAGVDGIEHGTRLTDQVIDLMLEKKAYYVPTMSGITELADREEKAGRPQNAELVRRLVVYPQRESVKKAYARGVLIGAGTDTLGGLVYELELMESCGFSKMDAIKSATSNAAKIIGKKNSLGQIKEGYIADLVLVGQDPLADLANLRDVKSVFFAGELVTADWLLDLEKAPV